MLKKVKLALLPVIVICLLNLHFTAPQGESFGKGWNLIMEWAISTAIVWALTLSPLIEIGHRYWQTRSLHETYLAYKNWFYISALGIVFPLMGVVLLRMKN